MKIRKVVIKSTKTNKLQKIIETIKITSRYKS